MFPLDSDKGRRHGYDVIPSLCSSSLCVIVTATPARVLGFARSRELPIERVAASPPHTRERGSTRCRPGRKMLLRISAP